MRDRANNWGLPDGRPVVDDRNKIISEIIVAASMRWASGGAKWFHVERAARLFLNGKAESISELMKELEYCKDPEADRFISTLKSAGLVDVATAPHAEREEDIAHG